MAPFGFTGATSVLITLAIGFGFGFVLERAGFGNARNLAAQFYLHDMRVLKVMFTAIVTAMLLVFAASSVGLLDFSRVWVPPTYLGPAIVGGLVLGVGFIVGGYCPGTSLVSMSTFKVDGLFFVLGVFFGLFAFAESVPLVWQFWNHAGAAGRLTLFDFAGVDAGIVVFGVFAMAVGAFWFAEKAEEFFRREQEQQERPSRIRIFRRSAVATGAIIAVAVAIAGQPSIEKRIAWNRTALDRKLASREVFIDPAELLGLMHNNQMQLILLDVRDQKDFNVFHLVDAQHVSMADLKTEWLTSIPSEAVVVAMSNDEQASTRAWERLAVHPNVNAYVLAGGINRWLDVYSSRLANVPGSQVVATGDDTLRHRFDRALGDRLAVARPGKKDTANRQFTPKVKVRKPVRSEGGGCG